MRSCFSAYIVVQMTKYLVQKANAISINMASFIKWCTLEQQSCQEVKGKLGLLCYLSNPCK